MGKKKFSRDSEDGGSTDDEATTAALANNGPACPHVGKAINISDLKKEMKKAWTRIGKCSQCDRDKAALKPRPLNPNDPKKKGTKKASVPAPAQATPKIVLDPNIPTDVWLCLRCGVQNCCPSSESSPTCVSHALQHYETPRSDLHCIVLNVTTWIIWCYDCKAELYLDSYKKLHESVDHVKKMADIKKFVPPPPNTTANTNITVKKESTFLAGPLKTSAGMSSNSVLPRARGLNNLGNTCFFNSVMQCLSATHPFVRFLDTHCQNGAKLSIPPVTISNSKLNRECDDSGLGNSCGSSQSATEDSEISSRAVAPTQVDSLSLQLAEAGPLTLASAAFFKEMHSVGIKSGPVNPGHLFGQICRRSPQFRGFKQQDAHELLRHLMDGLRTEEVRRQRSAILKFFGLTEKSDPKKVDEKIKIKVNALSKHSNYTLVDRLFGGHLVSTIVCEQCHNSSQIYEPFLDLSLPLVDQKPPRPGGFGNKSIKGDDDNTDISCFGKNKKKSYDENNDDNNNGEPAKSKHQLKKEREKSKKEKRKNKNRKIAETSETADNENKEEETNSKENDTESKDSSNLAQDGSTDLAQDGITDVAQDGSADLAQDGSANLVQDGSADLAQDEGNVESLSNSIKEEVLEVDHGEENKLEKEARENEKNSAFLKPQTPAKIMEKSPTSARKSEKTPSTAKKSEKSGRKGGSEEEDDEDGYSEEAEDDWEWDYGEQWKEGDDKNEEIANDNDKEDEEIEEVFEECTPEPDIPKQSLNPLPPEMLMRGSSERDKSSEPIPEDSEESETGASFNADIEDNLEDFAKPKPVDFLTKLSDSYRPDSNHLDPHMNELCKRVRKLSVASSNVLQDDTPNDLVESTPDDLVKTTMSRQTSKALSDETEMDIDEEANLVRLRQEWISRSLTSIAPRYQSQSGECSLYSSLSQFTAPELLTGSNRWACDRCTQLNHKLKGKDGEEDSKPTTVYSNASKQLLLFSPPSVLTIHLKRFQQTMSGLRKDNKRVQFPFELNLAPFCSATALSAPNIDAGTEEILYELYGIVEHSGQLQGGHYTAYVKVRPTKSTDFSRFYSAPVLRSDDFQHLMAEIERKCREKGDGDCAKNVDETAGNSPASSSAKWYHISDSSVAEASEEKVLKSQAYILFYERIR